MIAVVVVIVVKEGTATDGRGNGEAGVHSNRLLLFAHSIAFEGGHSVMVVFFIVAC